MIRTGNSVAVCGLAGLIALACWRPDARLPSFGAFALLLWCAVMLSTWARPAAVVGGICAAGGLRLQLAGWRYAGVRCHRDLGRGVLACVQNIHAALLVGPTLAALLSGVARQPVPARSAEAQETPAPGA